MKFKSFIGVGLMLATGLAFIGCSSDNAPDGPDKVLNAGTTFYVRVAVSNTDGTGTRANGEGENDDFGNYSDGTTPENEIRKVLFVFYDAEGDYVADSELDKSQTTIASGNIESLVDVVVPVTLQTEAKVPAYVVAYVNPSPLAGPNTIGSLSDIQANTRTLAQVLPKKKAISDVDNAGKEEGEDPVADNPATDLGTNTNGFLMTNSVYYEADADAPVVGTPIPAGALYDDKTDAAKADATKINIYVERVMGKVIVNENLQNGQQGTITDNGETVVTPDGQTSYTLDFQELAWGLTNEEKLGFVLKNFRTNKVNQPSSVTNMSYADAKTAMSTLTSPSWNFPAQTDVNQGRRSFWAYSYNYFNEDANYPEFADEYKGNETTYPLDQTKFSDIYNTTNKTVGAKGHAFGTAGYTLENTVSLATLNNTKAGERAIVNALVVGKYVVKDAKGKDVTYNNLYIRRNVDNKNVIYVGDDFMKKSFFGTQIGDGVIYTMTIKTEGDKKTEEYNPVVWSEENEGDFEIVHPSKDVTGMFTASRYITMLLRTGLTDLSTTTGEGDSAVTTYKYYYRNSNGIMTAVTDANIADVRSAMYKFFNSKLGSVEMFNGGYAYFKVPIRHLWGRDNKGFGDSASATQDGFVLGQYGVVRNHVYNINVTAIGGIGTGLSNPDDPIVIPIKEKEYHVATVIRAQRWRIVPTQDVTLKP